MSSESGDEHGFVGRLDSRTCGLSDLPCAGAGTSERRVFGVPYVSRLVEAERSEAGVYVAGVARRIVGVFKNEDPGSKSEPGDPSHNLSQSESRGFRPLRRGRGNARSN